MTSDQLMSKPATLSKLIVIGLLGALSLLLVEIRFEHREALAEAWQSWIPLLYCGAMLARTEAALRMVTASDTQVLRLVATPNAPAAAHGNYRTRPGPSDAVLTFSDLPPPPSGKTYQAWAQREDKWISLGQGVPDASGRGLIVYEERAPLAPPQELQLTLEPEGGSASPTGPPLISWPGR